MKKERDSKGKFVNGNIHSKEVRKNISKALTGRTLSKENKKNISKSLIGHKTSIETRNKIAKKTKENMLRLWKDSKYRNSIKRYKGAEHQNYGNPLPQKQRIKISKSVKKDWEKNYNKYNERRNAISKTLKRHFKNPKERKRMRNQRIKQILPVKDTTIEIKIQEFLKLLGIDFFTHKYIKEIEHGYQCDILIPSMNLVIECDGNYWHKYPIGNDIDNIRTKELIEKGFKVLRLWENEIRVMTMKDFKERLNE